MFRDARRKQISSIHIHPPKLLHPLVRVGDGVVVLREAGRGDEVINLAVLGDDLAEGLVDRIGGCNVAVVGGDLGCAEGAVFLAHLEFCTVVLFRIGVLVLEIRD